MNTEDKNWRLSYNPLHLKYWIFILILLIVGLFSYFYSGDDNLTSMIAFATTIASIILSVLAIFMTLLSNNSIGGMLHKVRDLHDTVLSIPNSLDVSISDLRETTSGLLAVNSEVNKAISTLGNRLEDLEKHLAQNEIKMDNILNSLSTDKSGNSHSYENPTEKQIDQYLNTLSLNGIYLLFGIYKYQEKKKVGIFSLDTFSKSIFGAEPSYLLGILVASTSINIVKYDTVEESNNMNIKNMTLSSHIRLEVLSERITDICGDIGNRFTELRHHYDAKAVEKSIIDYVDTID